MVGPDSALRSIQRIRPELEGPSVTARTRVPWSCALRGKLLDVWSRFRYSPGNSSSSPAANPLRRSIQVIVVSSVMFTFISYWRTAAVVLCDLASTAYYIGGIVEGAIGPAAPWFILAVMLFSYCVRSIYIESCSLFVRGGVYRVVKEAMGGFLAKLSVSALMFDYILTGPTSAVSAGAVHHGPRGRHGPLQVSRSSCKPARRGPISPVGAPSSSRSRSRSISSARTSSASTSRAARR